MSVQGTVLDELGDLPERIRVSSDRVTSLRAQLNAELAIRDQLIVEAHDHAGMKQRDIATAAGVTVQSVIRVLAGSSED